MPEYGISLWSMQKAQDAQCQATAKTVGIEDATFEAIRAH
jgi:hypothetical protein